MGRARDITRRAFLTGSVAITGGVAFGTWMVATPFANPLAAVLPVDAATFNPWVMVTSDRVTLIAPHTDLGQGVRHAQAALIAEELDIDLAQVDIIPGAPSGAYANGAFAEDGLPFLPQDRSAFAQSARSVARRLISAIGVQGTGGSTSMADSFDKLRHAGASARETFKTAAAARTGTPIADLRTETGAVVLPDGGRIAYTDLAADAARIAPVRDVALRPASAWRLIGKPMPRIDMVAKSTGTLAYGIDLARDGMVHATVLLNPRQGGALLGYDPAPALAVAGVAQVIEITGGLAIIANNTWTAFEGARALAPEWGPAAYPADQADHWAAVANAFAPAHLDRRWRTLGDPGTAIAPDAETLEYRAPYLAHAPLEPLGALIHVTQTGADIWVGHQMPGIAEGMVADITGLPADAVHLHNQYVGGSFGHRLESENIRSAAEIGLALRGTPVKLTYSREEDMAHDFPRQIAIGRARGAVANGQVSALDLAIAAPSVLASQFGRMGFPSAGPDAAVTQGAWNMPYALPHLAVTGYRAPDLAPISSWRSVGASHAGFFAESALDELIHAAGADPMAERLRLCDFDLARACLEAVAEMSDWGRDPGPGRGRGVALVVSFGTPVAEVVQVADTPDGIRIEKVWVAAEIGRMIDPVNFENNVQGGVIWGLGHAMNCEITYEDGMAQQTNYHAHAGMRMYQCPEIFVRGLENGDKIRGIGEPPVPPAAPALANAIFAATGQRLREMPFEKFVRFV